MSRTAREAQRKLNHSIIEKARRTKINDALATLRTLVPERFGETAEDGIDEEEAVNTKSGGKKAEKEKEFKLEILVRTVSYMQHLIGRVGELEAAVEQQGPKRKRIQSRDDDSDDNEEPRPIAHRRKRRNSQDFDRLPPISSWLQEDSAPPSPVPSSQLPTPPSSTTFAPVSQLFQSPPNFSLSSPVDDDHSAANILLHMSTSRRGRQAEYQDSHVRATPLTPSALLGLGRR